MRLLQIPELYWRVVNVSEFHHLVGEVIGVHQPDSCGESEDAVFALDALDPETSVKVSRISHLKRLIFAHCSNT